VLNEKLILQRFLEESDAEGVYEKLQKYSQMVFYWTNRFNLVGQNEKEHFFQRHICDILPVLEKYPIQETVLDFGTGGGIPGIPLAIFRPDIKVCLNDINSKKVIFLKKCKFELELKNVEVFEGDFNLLELENYKNIISRAVTQIHKISENILKKMSEESRLIYMKNICLENEEELWLEKHPDNIDLDEKYKAIDGMERRLIVLKP